MKKLIVILPLLICMLLPSCFTMAISDPSGKNKPVSDTARKILFPVTIVADVITSPVQVVAVGGYIAARHVTRSKGGPVVPSVNQSSNDTKNNEDN